MTNCLSGHLSHFAPRNGNFGPKCKHSQQSGFRSLFSFHDVMMSPVQAVWSTSKGAQAAMPKSRLQKKKIVTAEWQNLTSNKKKNRKRNGNKNKIKWTVLEWNKSLNKTDFSNQTHKMKGFQSNVFCFFLKGKKENDCEKIVWT